MVYYRLRRRDGHGCILSFDEYSAADDAEAARLAEALIADHEGDLWCGERLVAEYHKEARAARG